MKKNLAKATALLLTAGMIGGTGLTAAASDVELNPAGTYPVLGKACRIMGMGSFCPCWDTNWKSARNIL